MNYQNTLKGCGFTGLVENNVVYTLSPHLKVPYTAHHSSYIFAKHVSKVHQNSLKHIDFLLTCSCTMGC